MFSCFQAGSHTGSLVGINTGEIIKNRVGNNLCHQYISGRKSFQCRFSIKDSARDFKEYRIKIICPLQISGQRAITILSKKSNA